MFCHYASRPFYWTYHSELQWKSVFLFANGISFSYWRNETNIEILLTYLLTPRCRVLREKLTGLQLVKKFPAFHGTWRFITALTSVRHLSLSWASPIQSIFPHPTSWRSILILSTHLCLGLPSGLLPSGFPTKTLYTPSPHPYAPHAQPISLFSSWRINVKISIQALRSTRGLLSVLGYLSCDCYSML